jgi:hypothetical protein
MLREAIQLLSDNHFIDGNSLPDDAPGHTYHYRSSSPNIIVPAPSLKKEITNLLKSNGYNIKPIGGMLKISR